MHNDHDYDSDALYGRYPDLLGCDNTAGAGDANALRLIHDLDAVYAQGKPPASRARMMEQAIQAHAHQLHEAAAQPATPRRITITRVWTQSAVRQTTPRRAITSRRRIQTLAAGAAALIIVVLMAALLHTAAGGHTGDGISSIDPQLRQHGGIVLHLSASWYCPADEQPCVTSCPSGGCKLSDYIPGAIVILNGRFAYALQVSEVVMRRDGASGILLQIPGITSDQRIRSLLAPGSLDILDTGTTVLPVGSDASNQTCQRSCQPGQYHIAFTGSQLDPSSVSMMLDRQSGKPVVTFAFAGSAKAQFAQYTRDHIGEALTITLDGKVIESATIQSEIANQGQITGLQGQIEARNLAAIMKYGPLPLALHVVREEIVNPDGSVKQISPNAACATPTAKPAQAATPTTMPTATPAQPATPTTTPTAKPAQAATPTTMPTATPAQAAATPTASEAVSASCPTPIPAVVGPTPTITAARAKMPAATPNPTAPATAAPPATPIPTLTATPSSR